MDDIGSTTYLLILVLLMLSAFFSASETAFSAANMIRLRTMAEDGNKRAAQAVKVAAQYDKLIATILIGNNLVNIAISSLVTVIATAYFKIMRLRLLPVFPPLSFSPSAKLSPRALPR